MLRRYGTEHDTGAGQVLFADGDLTYDLFVILAGEVRIVERLGQPGETVIASYGRSQFLGEIGLLTGQRAYLSAVAATAGRVLRVPVERVRVVMAQEPGLSELILRTFLLRHSILTGRGSGLTLIGAVGDVRSGSVKRAATAIGEGSMAVRLVFERLQATGSAVADPPRADTDSRNTAVPIAKEPPP